MSRLVSGIYHSIYTRPEFTAPAATSRKLSAETKHARKVEREIATTLRQMQNAEAVAERDREMHREQQARWAKANPDCIRDAQRKWKDKQDPALFREYDAKRYELHGEEIKARKRARYQANKRRINAKRRAERAAKRAERGALRKPMKKMGPVIMPASRV